MWLLLILIFRSSKSIDFLNPVEFVDFSDSTDRDARSEEDDCYAQDIVIAAGELLQVALVTDTENDGKYPNRACQTWNIMTDENQVYSVF